MFASRFWVKFSVVIRVRVMFAIRFWVRCSVVIRVKYSARLDTGLK